MIKYILSYLFPACYDLCLFPYFYITLNMALSLAARAREIFESSEVCEKR